MMGAAAVPDPFEKGPEGPRSVKKLPRNTRPEAPGRREEGALMG